MTAFAAQGLEYEAESFEPQSFKHWQLDRPSPNDLISDWETAPLEQEYGIYDAYSSGIVDIEPFIARRDIIAAIEESKLILDLEDNWDDDESEGYEPKTWERATAFLTAHADIAATTMGKCLTTPLISPAQSGSIDLYWRENGRTLLINFPCNSDERPSYFGESAFAGTIQGMIGTDAPRLDLVAWLVQS